MKFIFVIGVLFASVTVSAQSLTDAKVLAAITAGASKKVDTLMSECVATAGFGEHVGSNLTAGVKTTGGYNVTVSGSEGRIAFLAQQAKRLYKSFTLQDVTDAMRQPAFVVNVEPGEPTYQSKTIQVAAPIDHVVLKSKVNAATVQPSSVEKERVEWNTLPGGKVEGNRAVAVFDVAAVTELPRGDFDVVVITASGERRCKVGEKDRKKLLLY